MIEIKKCDYDAYELPINQIELIMIRLLLFSDIKIFVCCMCI